MCIQTYASLKYQYQTDMLFSAKRLILRFIFLKQGVYLAHMLSVVCMVPCATGDLER